jgi:hypothetical protein
MNKTLICQICNKNFVVRDGSTAKFCSYHCYWISKKGRKWGRPFIKGGKSWNSGKTGLQISPFKGLTKYDHPSLMSNSIKNSEKTKLQYLRTGKEQWLLDRKRFTRKGKKNSDKQKNAARIAIHKTIESGRLRQKYHDTNIEVKVANILKDLGIQFEKQKRIPKIVTPDLYIPIIDTHIFCDGDHWHSLANVVKRDLFVNSKLTELQIKFIRFKGSLILKEPDKVKDLILKLMI